MSGGSYDYKYCTLENYYVGAMYDDEMNDMIKDLVEVLHDLEWWRSCDIGEEDYRKTLNEFKAKWFKQDRSDRLKKYIDDKLEKTKKEFYDLLGGLDE